MTVQTVVAEVGPDLSRWKTERHWTCWLNLAPKRYVSGGRVIRHVRQHHTNRAGNAFRMAAQSLVRSQSYLGVRYRYLRAKLGGLKGVKAMARFLACLYYRLLTQGQIWVDRGTQEFNRRSQQRELAALERKARKHGLQLVPAASRISGYRRSHRRRDNAPFIRSTTHAPDQTGGRPRLLHCDFNLATPSHCGLLPGSERFS
jgi:transposase